MAIADMIPTLADDALASLHLNARRLSQGAPGPKTAEAAALLPLVETELAARQALKPPPKTAKPRVSRAKAKVVEVEEVEELEDEVEEV